MQTTRNNNQNQPESGCLSLVLTIVAGLLVSFEVWSGTELLNLFAPKNLDNASSGHENASEYARAALYGGVTAGIALLVLTRCMSDRPARDDGQPSVQDIKIFIATHLLAAPVASYAYHLDISIGRMWGGQVIGIMIAAILLAGIEKYAQFDYRRSFNVPLAIGYEVTGHNLLTQQNGSTLYARVSEQGIESQNVAIPTANLI